MYRGYVKLWRKSEDSSVFKNDALWKLWTWCLMQATHEPIDWAVQTGRGETLVHIDTGQFVFGRRTAAKALGGTPSGTWKRMQKLQTMQNLTIESNRHYSLITIANWHLYQPPKEKGDHQGNHQVTTKEPPSNHQGDTYKKRPKNKENIKKEMPPIPAELDTDAFRESWGHWLQHRKENKKPMTELAVKKQFNKLVKIGAARAVEAIDHSIASGYQGIFEDSKPGQQPKKRYDYSRLMKTEEADNGTVG